MSRPESKLALKDLIYGTYSWFRSRINNQERDFLKVIEVKKVFTYKGGDTSEPSMKFVIQTQSTPQYAPYFRKTDSRGRVHLTQRKVHHHYDVTFSLKTLSVSAPVRYRCGSDCSVLFGPQYRSQFDKRGRMLKEDANVLRGRNWDFAMCLEWILDRDFNALFGRNWMKGAPDKRNPHHLPFLEKHGFTVAKFLVDRGIIT